MVTINGEEVVIPTINGNVVERISINGNNVYGGNIDASGGTTVTDATIDGTNYRIHAFENTGNSTFNVSSAPSGKTVDVMLVAGGGGGGGGDSGDGSGGGGGAGGLVFKENISVSEGSYSISVGDGGSRGRFDGNNGEDTKAFGFTAIGGGAGGDGDAT